MDPSKDKKKETLWYRLWEHKSPEEKKRVRSFIPLILYTVAVLYGVIYLSILNSVNRGKAGTMVKSWWGGDQEEFIAKREKEKKEVLDSFKASRKRVSGGF